MPFPSISGRKSLYRRYLRYSDYDRLRHGKHLKRWLNSTSTQLTGTGTNIAFGVDVSTAGSEVFTTASAHGLSVGDGPFELVPNMANVFATKTMSVDMVPTAGDTITVTGITQTTTYTFIARGSTPSGAQIEIGTNRVGTADNVRSVLSTHPDITVGGTGRPLVITAASGGSTGNSINIAASNDSSITGEGNLADGADAVVTEPLQVNVGYFIGTVPSATTFTLTQGADSGIIRPVMAGTGSDSLTPGTSPSSIYELLRSFPAVAIGMEDDIDDLFD